MTKDTRFVNANVVLPDRILSDASVQVQKGLIHQIDSTSNLSVTEDPTEVIDVEAAPPGGHQVGAAPVSPVGIGTPAVESRGAPSPVALRRLRERYQEAVRRFFSTSRSTPEAPPKDDL